MCVYIYVNQNKQPKKKKKEIEILQTVTLSYDGNKEEHDRDQGDGGGDNVAKYGRLDCGGLIKETDDGTLPVKSSPVQLSFLFEFFFFLVEGLLERRKKLVKS